MRAEVHTDGNANERDDEGSSNDGKPLREPRQDSAPADGESQNEEGEEAGVHDEGPTSQPIQVVVYSFVENLCVAPVRVHPRGSSPRREGNHSQMKGAHNEPGPL